jgi:hypothetical protein
VEAGSVLLEGAAGASGETRLARTRRGRPRADEMWAAGCRWDGAGSGPPEGAAGPAWHGQPGPELGAGGGDERTLMLPRGG